MALEFSERDQAHPGLSGRRRLRAAGAARARSRATSRPTRRCRRCARRSSARSARSTATPTRPTRCCAQRLSRPLRRAGVAHRDRQRLLRHPARGRRGAARAGRRARLRVAVVLGLPAPRGRLRARARSPSRSTRDERHDLAAMLREITVATRLVIVCNPNNPTSTALPLAEIAAFVAEVPPHVCVIVDEAYCEFNLLEDPDASIELLDAPPQPRAAAHLLEGLRPLRAARRLRAVRLGGAAARARPGAPAVLLQRARPGRRGRGARPPGRGRSSASTRTVAERISVDERLRALGLDAGRLAGQLLLVRARRGPRRGSRSMRGLAERGVLVRGGGALGSDGPRCASPTALPEENERFLEALAEVL